MLHQWSKTPVRYRINRAAVCVATSLKHVTGTFVATVLQPPVEVLAALLLIFVLWKLPLLPEYGLCSPELHNLLQYPPNNTAPRPKRPLRM